jgi:hypothetical protein
MRKYTNDFIDIVRRMKRHGIYIKSINVPPPLWSKLTETQKIYDGQLVSFESTGWFELDGIYYNKQATLDGYILTTDAIVKC